jgi:hypothetical protein
MKVSITTTFEASDGEVVEELQKEFVLDLDDSGEVDLTYKIIADFDDDAETISVRSDEIKVE